MKKGKLINLIIGAALVISIGFVLFIMAVSAGNNAISKEEQVSTAVANISKEEQRRIDLFNNLVDSIEDYKDYEGDTLSKITEARTQASKGNVEAAAKTIDVVVENYPALKADSTYKIAMKEFSITENRVANNREAYNTSVKEYRRFIRKFPTSFLLGLNGYETQDFKYLDFKVDNSKAANLFGGK